MKDPIVRCRYHDKYLACTAEAVDPIGEVLLCTTHLGRALEMLRRTAPQLFLLNPRRTVKEHA